MPLLWRAQVFLQELLNLVGVSFHLVGVEQEGRLGAGGQVLQNVWLPNGGRKHTECKINTGVVEDAAASTTEEGWGKEVGRRKWQDVIQRRHKKSQWSLTASCPRW